MAFRRKKDTAVTAEQVEQSVAPAMRVAAAWSWRFLVVAAAVALVGFVVTLLRDVAVPVFVAILLAALLVPLSNWLQRHRWPKALAVAVCELGVLVVIGGLVTVIVITVRSGLPELQRQTAAKFDSFVDFLGADPFNLSKKDITKYVDQAVASVQNDSSGLLSGALSLGTTAGHVLAGALIALFTTLFILIDGRGMWRWIVRLFPVRARAAIMGAGEAGWITLTTFVKVQIFVAFVDAVGIGLGAFLLGVFVGQPFPLVIPIAIAVFLGSFIPVVGAVATGIFAVFVALIYLGPIPALFMLGIVVLVQQLEGHVLQPFVMGNAVKVHPVAVVLSVATGGFVAGIPGALFAVPLVAMLNVMITYIARGDWRLHPHPRVSDVLPLSKGSVARVD
ncbi:MAG TPA: AI-2E family transporter [Pseudolysinimonas sp.]|nr:AI-2E family transporter [Pseudolysinimonas sp.]